MEPAKSRIRRCAIYTRKSSEEGLEQDFNSLHAQREACEAYVKSQAGEGWHLVTTAYDDGGYSGGSMERPALLHLLEDIRQKQVDVVVVYKVDRLTRSLADFAKMVEVFDAQGVSFVSVTQQFNTTTSMGRLTLNVLLSFAQFEREVTGERIRDKIAASKRKGMWMGGTTPLGYDVKDRHLIINRAEAATVKQIYERYLELGSVRLLKQDLDRRGVSSKARVSMKGLKSGGRSFSRGALYELLANPIYIGEIRHKRERHLGLHDAILERELWERVQQKLREQAARRGRRPTKAGSSPLAGLLFDQSGEPLYAQSTAKGARRYRYYVSKSLITGSAKDAQRGWRLSATEIERAVAIAARAILDDRVGMLEALEKSEIDSPDVRAMLETAMDYSRRLIASIDVAACLTDLVERVELLEQGIRVSIKLPVPSVGQLEVPFASAIHLSRLLPLRMKRRGVETRIILEGCEDTPRKVDPGAAESHRARHAMVRGVVQVRSLAEIARRDGLPKRYVERLTKLAFLAPRIVEAVVEGRAAAGLNLQMLIDGRFELSPEWSEQQRQLAHDLVAE
ncbi:MAG: recombinase family protein [Candidatus Binatus sp.]|uniref:recombinase family protein n=1 Tax=Candidatus Binatus sp. TaxID=2811406 RepID=UPI00271CCB52|nr:recombinase family protein [Candidatus Binatus sp.]MDO8433859.1 recombinase family protein [Candidatus Binatus sp.]